ncbi:Pyruvate kinase PKLR [Trichinella patagoniensis]|uniref:Pyruvate kinase n=1 Tax=Trichinella patagoniensis TaxID=990121 RepID=A0A0V0ZI39_9BILA|nr:Pyruvate kinase PKLR [Trichinella patagoniensis]
MSEKQNQKSRKLAKVAAIPAKTTLEHLCRLDTDHPVEKLVSKTGLICTIGPASCSVETLTKMIQAGMTIARLNFSHGSHDYHAQTVANIRKAVDSLAASGNGKVVAIALDTKGPEIRTGYLAVGSNEEVVVEANSAVRVTVDSGMKFRCTESLIYVDYENMPKVVSKGSKIYIDDGLISLLVNEVSDNHLDCVVEHGGKLGNCKGVNLPDCEVDLPAVSEKDAQDLQFAVKHQCDMVFASFVRSAEAVRQIRQTLGVEGRGIKIVAKIENRQGIANVDSIIEEADGVMIARGDLGIEIPAEQVFVAQKAIIAKCRLAGKPAICATQMLESMVDKARPTRAEITDVANAVLDGADCVMLSGETAKGRHPVQAVRTMHQICCQAESVFFQKHFFDELQAMLPRPMNAMDTIAFAVTTAAANCNASAIILLTNTGASAVALSKCRPSSMIISVVKKEQTARYLRLYSGVLPCVYDSKNSSSSSSPNAVVDWVTSVDQRINYAILFGKKERIIHDGDNVIVVNGWREGPGHTNTIRIFAVEPLIARP